jgi:hypothetical protein
MSNSLTPLNLSAAALGVLQTRSTAALTPVKTEANTGRNLGPIVVAVSELLPLPPASGSAIPRGQILNILV